MRELTALGNPLDMGAGREKRHHVSEEETMLQAEMGSQKSKYERQEVGERVDLLWVVHMDTSSKLKEDLHQRY